MKPGAVHIALCAMAVALSSACASTHTVKTTGGGGPGTTTTKAPANPKISTGQAKIGTRIALNGESNGERMAVTVTKVVQTARSSDEFSTPSAGHRFYAVQFRLTNIGSATYSDSPSNGAQVVDSRGQSYDSTFANAANCQTFPAQENIAPGNSGLGCIVFEIPTRAVITGTQFTLDSGFGPDTGQWKVG